ncbi:MAG: alpha-N-acetylglucosaminidase [Bacteroidota bacterium]
MRQIILSVLFLLLISCNNSEIKEDVQLFGLVERYLPGRSNQILFEEIESADGKDFFELESKNKRIIIRGNNPVSMATGFNWYLKYHGQAMVSWCGNNLTLPEQLPVIVEKVRKETDLPHRYNFNYCTFGYSTAWWDWERWEQEIDWMALHGVNMPLMIVGEEAVWQNTLRRLGYSEEEAFDFLPGPSYIPFTLMNVMESWRGPLPQSWIDRQVELRKKIQARMEEYGMQPVFHGFGGMIPYSLKKQFPDANIHDPGFFSDFQRSGFISPSDSLFHEIAAIYYEEQRKLFGTASYYNADPIFHGGSVAGVDLKEAGTGVVKAMKKASPGSKWIIQGWQANPRKEMIEHLKPGDLIVLDLWAEVLPQWGDPDSRLSREEGFNNHQWIWCMLHNFGGNVGMYGRIDDMVKRWELSESHPLGNEKIGIGATMEGIENNPIMYELLFELPWHNEKIDPVEWVKAYSRYRYGHSIPEMEQAWEILHQTAYNCTLYQEGVSESVFCARPSLKIKGASTWGETRLYYEPEKFEKAWPLLLSQKSRLGHLETFQYDLVDYTRQVLANRGYLLHKDIVRAYQEKDLELFDKLTGQFLELISDQDRLLATQKLFTLGRWLELAKEKGSTPEEKQYYEWNARTHITIWGTDSYLHDYAHREWSGLLKDFYYPRWEMFFKKLQKELKGEKTVEIDFYAWEDAWTRKQNEFPSEPVEEPVKVVSELFKKYH